MAKLTMQPALNRNSLVFGSRSVLYWYIASWYDCPAILHFSSKEIIGSPLRNITRSTRSLSLAQTSSITEKIFCSYFFIRSWLKSVAGRVYIRSRCMPFISIPCFRTFSRLPRAFVISELR